MSNSPIRVLCARCHRPDHSSASCTAKAIAELEAERDALQSEYEQVANAIVAASGPSWVPKDSEAPEPDLLAECVQSMASQRDALLEAAKEFYEAYEQGQNDHDDAKAYMAWMARMNAADEALAAALEARDGS